MKSYPIIKFKCDQENLTMLLDGLNAQSKGKQAQAGSPALHFEGEGMISFANGEITIGTHQYWVADVESPEWKEMWQSTFENLVMELDDRQAWNVVNTVKNSSAVFFADVDMKDLTAGAAKNLLVTNVEKNLYDPANSYMSYITHCPDLCYIPLTIRAGRNLVRMRSVNVELMTCHQHVREIYNPTVLFNIQFCHYDTNHFTPVEDFLGETFATDIRNCFYRDHDLILCEMDNAYTALVPQPTPVRLPINWLPVRKALQNAGYNSPYQCNFDDDKFMNVVKSILVGQKMDVDFVGEVELTAIDPALSRRWRWYSGVNQEKINLDLYL